MFWPPRPMAIETSSAGTVTRARGGSSSSWSSTAMGLAGASERLMNSTGSGVHGITSMFSLPSSRTTAWMRLPLTPTQAPTGSTRSSWLMTATLARSPGSRTTFLISTMPS